MEDTVDPDTKRLADTTVLVSDGNTWKHGSVFVVRTSKNHTWGFVDRRRGVLVSTIKRFVWPPIGR
jgi:hypothetical protein